MIDSVDIPSDEYWDAGALSCGELVIELRRRMKLLRPGQILHLIALDEAAPLDVRAWCRITKHPLRSMRHPHYWIERKED